MYCSTTVHDRFQAKQKMFAKGKIKKREENGGYAKKESKGSFFLHEFYVIVDVVAFFYLLRIKPFSVLCLQHTSQSYHTLCRLLCSAHRCKLVQEFVVIILTHRSIRSVRNFSLMYGVYACVHSTLTLGSTSPCCLKPEFELAVWRSSYSGNFPQVRTTN